MLTTGVFVGMAVLLGVAVWLQTGVRRTRLLLVCSAAALLAVSGCSSDGDTTASAVSSEMPSAEATGSAMESGTVSAMPTTATSMGSAAASGSATDSNGQAQLCDARDDLRTSLDALTDPSLLTQGGTAIGAAVDQAQTDLDAVVTAGRPELQPQLDALQSALEQMRNAVGSLGDGGVAENLQAVTSAVSNVGSSWSDLQSELNDICGA